MRRKYVLALLVVLLLGASVVGSVLFRHSAEPVNITVDFRLTPLESNDPLPNVPVRLVFGAAPGWQNKDAGYRFVTDADGRAKFTTTGVVDRRWRMEPVAMTPLSWPKRSNHIMIAAELDQPVPQKDGTYSHMPWLHTLDLDCDSSQCATSDIVWIYTRDAQGNFTRPVEYVGEPSSLSAPELNGMLLGGPGYKAADFWLSTDDPQRKQWDVKLVLQRRPPPVLR
ncbi:MAG TPA: hypothetical protein VL382_03455 [Terriglobales bacterium]|nr:hypothetical protein [Terriglobales bacterium]